MDATTIATSFLDAIESLDGTAIAGFLNDDSVYDDGHGNRHVGGEAIRDALVERTSALNERHADRLVLVSSGGDRVAIETTLRGAYERGIENWPPANGQSYSVPAALVFEIEGGRIRRFSRYLDQASLTAALS